MSEKVKIVVNGEQKDLQAPLNLFDVLEQQGVIEMMIAVAKNGEFVAKDTWAETDIKEGDVIDVVSPMQGG